MKFALGRGGEGEVAGPRHGPVHRRFNSNKEGEPIEYAHTNLRQLLDFRKYDVEYADRHLDKLTANVIAESLIAQVFPNLRGLTYISIKSRV